jgi:hypothetical protein
MHIGVVIMFQTLPMPLLHKIAGLELSDVRITLAGTIHQDSRTPYYTVVWQRDARLLMSLSGMVEIHRLLRKKILTVTMLRYMLGAHTTTDLKVSEFQGAFGVGFEIQKTSTYRASGHSSARYRPGHGNPDIGQSQIL